MYVGAITDATPTATPPITLKPMSMTRELANPLPTALTRNSAAAAHIARRRP